MSLDNFKEYISKLPSELIICFAGMCEPWLNPECSKMVLYAYAQGHRVTVLTTLAGMQLSDIELLEDITFRQFQVHLPSDPPQEKIPINDKYLKVLDRLSNSNIAANYHCHEKTTHPKIKSILDDNHKTIEFRALYQRVGNIKIRGRLKMARKRGALKCTRQQRNNVLLPNGDVLLCSNDYEMQHILGNLINSSYESLFSGPEYRKVVNGLKDESYDIICRYCDNFCDDSNISSFANNFYYRLDRYFYYIKRISSFSDLGVITGKVRKGIGKYFR